VLRTIDGSQLAKPSNAVGFHDKSMKSDYPIANHRIASHIIANHPFADYLITIIALIK